MKPDQLELVDGASVHSTTDGTTVVVRFSVHKERFLAGVFETWLAPNGKANKDQRERAAEAARAAMKVLDG